MSNTKDKIGGNANKKGLLYCAQAVIQEYTQETTLFCTCAQESVEVSSCQRNFNNEFSSLPAQKLEMDSKNNKLGEEKKEVTLQELLEVAMIETTSGNSEKNNIAKTPW